MHIFVVAPNVPSDLHNAWVWPVYPAGHGPTALAPMIVCPNPPDAKQYVGLAGVVARVVDEVAAGVVEEDAGVVEEDAGVVEEEDDDDVDAFDRRRRMTKMATAIRIRTSVTKPAPASTTMLILLT